MTRKTPLELTRTDQALSALGELLQAAGTPFEIVVVGGAALQALGLVLRPTADVDILAIIDREVQPADALQPPDALPPADPLPPALMTAVRRVAADFGLPEDWLNPGPTALLQWGLPDGFMARATQRRYGALTVWFASRYDQIHLKLFAFADLGGGRHEADLRILRPTREELLAAAAWARTQDPSEAFRSELVVALDLLGVDRTGADRMGVDDAGLD